MAVKQQFFNNGVTFSSPPLIDKDGILVEWRLFKRALVQESRLVREERRLPKHLASLQDVKVHMEASGAYTGIFPEMFKLLNNIILVFL